MNLPSVSIITCSYNTPFPLWEKCLKAIASQKYPKKLIQHIIMDAGSTNGSIDLAKSYGCTVIVRKDLLHLSQKRMSIGIQKSKGEIILFLEPDNIMTSTDWLARMVEPFKDRDIVGSYSMHNAYSSGMSALSTYFALIGANDPILLYLGKSEKNLIYKKSYSLGNTLYEKENYLSVKFTPQTLPTLGDNGHMVRKKVIDLVNTNPNRFVHVDAFYQMAVKHYDTYGVVKNTIIHDNCPDNNIYKALAKRVEYKEMFTDRSLMRRLYLVFNRHSLADIMRLVIYMVFSVTVVPMLLFSVVGFLRHPHISWFFHPFVCFWEVIVYTISELRVILYNRPYARS